MRSRDERRRWKRWLVDGHRQRDVDDGELDVHRLHRIRCTGDLRGNERHERLLCWQRPLLLPDDDDDGEEPGLLGADERLRMEFHQIVLWLCRRSWNE